MDSFLKGLVVTPENLIIDAEVLGNMLRKERSVILKNRREDLTKAPGEPKTLPVECTPPGTKNPIWRLETVLDWLEEFEAQRKSALAGVVADPIRRMGAPTKAERVAKRNAQKMNQEGVNNG
jgi:hypothetical protein